MEALIRMLAALLRVSVRLLPEGRREWGEAVWAEVDQVSPPRARLHWLLGAFGLVARQAHLFRAIVLAVLTTLAAVAEVRYGWHGRAPDDPSIPIHRAQLIATVVMLAGLPWLVRWRRVFGPVGDSAAARVVRVGSYAVLWAVLPVVIYLGSYAGARFGTCSGCDPADLAQWRSERISSATTGFVVLFALMAGYAIGILWLTAHRSPATPRTMAIGFGSAVVCALSVYAMLPFGGPVRIANPWLATLYYLVLISLLVVVAVGGPTLAVRPPAGQAVVGFDPSPGPGQGLWAGLLIGAVGALLLAVLTIPTMVLFPHQVPLKWANPDPNVAHGTPFEVQMSVGDGAQNYELFLILGPLLGFALGGTGAVLGEADQRQTVPPAPANSGS